MCMDRRTVYYDKGDNLGRRAFSDKRGGHDGGGVCVIREVAMTGKLPLNDTEMAA